MALFRPTYMAQRAYRLTPQVLAELGVKALILDVDNTLTTNDNPQPDADIVAWLAEMQKNGIKLMILSNNTRKRVEPFAQKLGLLFESSGAKPLGRGYKRCCERFNLPREQVAIVGDQLFTDIVGGNRYGVKTILVEPILMETGVLFFIKRFFEKPFLKAFRQGEQK